MSAARTTGRRDFLGQVGKTMAAAVGIAVIPGIAQGATNSGGKVRGASGPNSLIAITCCANATACGSGCGSGQVKFYCHRGGCPYYCTACQNASPNCYTFSVPSCP